MMDKTIYINSTLSLVALAAGLGATLAISELNEEQRKQIEQAEQREQAIYAAGKNTRIEELFMVFESYKTDNIKGLSNAAAKEEIETLLKNQVSILGSNDDRVALSPIHGDYSSKKTGNIVQVNGYDDDKNHWNCSADWQKAAEVDMTQEIPAYLSNNLTDINEWDAVFQETEVFHVDNCTSVEP